LLPLGKLMAVHIWVFLWAINSSLQIFTNEIRFIKVSPMINQTYREVGTESYECQADKRTAHGCDCSASHVSIKKRKGEE
jgi:hypothetical protein